MTDVQDRAWRDRAIDRSTEGARQRAARRVDTFLAAAREIIDERKSTEFTVQEVVDRSRQSLRSFYQYFDGKEELLLALFEDEMAERAAELRQRTSDGDPLARLESAVHALYDNAAPGWARNRPIAEFAQRLIINHPDEVAAAYSAIVEYLGEIVDEAAEAGLLRPGRPRRMAAIVLQAATVTAGRGPAARQPITADEVWEFCRHAIVPDPAD